MRLSGGSDFDRRFNRTHKFVSGTIIAIFVITIAIIVGGIFLTVHIVKEVGQHGLKNVVEEIWEGPDK
jgi:flagellar biosynthesis component FlhA